MALKGQKLKDRNNGNAILSSTNTTIEFDTNARVNIFQFNKISGSFTTTNISIEHSIDDGSNFNFYTDSESILIEEDNHTIIIDEFLTDVIKINFLSSDGNPEFEIFYRGVRDGKN